MVARSRFGSSSSLAKRPLDTLDFACNPACGSAHSDGFALVVLFSTDPVDRELGCIPLPV